MGHTFTFDATYEEEDIEGTVIGSIEVRIFYNYFPAQPAYTPRDEYAPIDPPEPASVELHNIQVERPVDGKLVFCDADKDEWRRLSAWIDADLYETLLWDGAEQLADRWDRAREYQHDASQDR